jgi:hypothetical protein
MVVEIIKKRKINKLEQKLKWRKTQNGRQA